MQISLPDWLSISSSILEALPIYLLNQCAFSHICSSSNDSHYAIVPELFKILRASLAGARILTSAVERRQIVIALPASLVHLQILLDRLASNSILLLFPCSPLTSLKSLT